LKQQQSTKIGITWLIGGLEHFIAYIGNFIIPTDELIFFRGVGIPAINKNTDYPFNNDPFRVDLPMKNGDLS
jgi:hypothetical protein